MSTTAATAPPPTVDAPPLGEVPLADHASLVLRAGRMGPVLPHMGWLRRFGTRISASELTDEAARLASSPYALGRRVLPRRVPGARRRWVATTEVPPVRLAPEPLDAEGLSAWLDEQLLIPLDPEHGQGWVVTAVPTTDGGTVVFVVLHHLYGVINGVLGAAYAPDGDYLSGTTGAPFEAPGRYGLRWELDGVGERLELGLLGAARAAADGVRAALRPRTTGPETDPPPLPTPRGIDRTRRAPGRRRSGVILTVPAAAWDDAAAERGGTGNTLLAALTANLVRRGRAGRGGDVDRAVRLVLPIDLGDEAPAKRRESTAGPQPTMVTAALTLPGGAPSYGDLRPVRAWMKAAFLADAASAPPVRGIGDAARLVPEALAIHAAKRAALGFDACASNPGPMPSGIVRLGEHRATACAVIGWPIGNDMIAALSRTPDAVSVTVVADDDRIGPDADLRAWVGDELRAWGLPDGRW